MLHGIAQQGEAARSRAKGLIRISRGGAVPSPAKPGDAKQSKGE